MYKYGNSRAPSSTEGGARPLGSRLRAPLSPAPPYHPSLVSRIARPILPRAARRPPGAARCHGTFRPAAAEESSGGGGTAFPGLSPGAAARPVPPLPRPLDAPAASAVPPPPPLPPAAAPLGAPAAAGGGGGRGPGKMAGNGSGLAGAGSGEIIQLNVGGTR